MTGKPGQGTEFEKRQIIAVELFPRGGYSKAYKSNQQNQYQTPND